MIYHGFEYVKSLVHGAFRCLRAQLKHLKRKRQLPFEAVVDRLEICANCPSQINGVCGECGCILLEKTQMADECCPLEEPKWSEYGDLKS